MALNAEEVKVSVTGAIYSFPTTEVAPENHNDALPLTAKEYGYTSEDGVEVSATKSITNILSWQNAAIVRSVVTESSIEVTFTLIQDNTNSRELFYGVAANVDGGYEWNPANSGGRKSFVIDAIDTAAGTKVRYYLPSAEVTAVEPVVLNSSSAISFGVTLTAYKTAAGYNSIVWHGTVA